MKQAFNLLVSGIFFTHTLVAWATGIIHEVDGDVYITNSRGELNQAKPNETVSEGDTISTGNTGAVIIQTDDFGQILVKSNSLVKFISFSNETDPKIALQLTIYRGGIRSFTGANGRQSDSSYVVKTPSSDIRLKAGDHEVLVVEDTKKSAGTFTKVHQGELEIQNEMGLLKLGADQVGYTPINASKAPSNVSSETDFFASSAIDKRFSDNERNLSEKQKDLTSKTNDQPVQQVKPWQVESKYKVGSFDDQRKSQLALEELFRHYEMGNVDFFRNRLDPSMIGYQQLIDNIVKETTQCKQMRLRLLDTQVQAGPDIAVIQTGWEKRCLMLPDFSPSLTTGNSTFLMHRNNSGWGMAALSGSNPFVASSIQPSLAKVSTTIGISCAAIAASSAPSNQPITITLNDADQIGASFVNVVVTTSNGDSEVITLSSLGNGSFTKNFLPILHNNGAPTKNNGFIEIASGITALVCSTLTVSYQDAVTPSGAPQTVQITSSIP